MFYFEFFVRGANLFLLEAKLLKLLILIKKKKKTTYNLLNIIEASPLANIATSLIECSLLYACVITMVYIVGNSILCAVLLI